MSWKLKRTKQCAKCPWRVDVDPFDIPNGYDPEKHRGLESTIAQENDLGFLCGNRSAMACHETHDAHCIGWLVNQVGRGNNIGLRIQMISCENARQIQTVGEQHERFKDTLPTKAHRAAKRHERLLRTIERLAGYDTPPASRDRSAGS